MEMDAREHHGVRADAQAQHADDELGGDAGLVGLQGLRLHQGVHVPVRLDALLPLPLPQLLQDLCNIKIARSASLQTEVCGNRNGGTFDLLTPFPC